jgi:hypothetical protein
MISKSASRASTRRLSQTATHVQLAPSRAYEKRLQSKGFPVRSVIDRMPTSEIADAAIR